MVSKGQHENSDRVDICLLLEGTWPYVRGGVSTWVHQILTALPDLRFSVVYLGAEKRLAGECKYEIPGNVASIRELFLFEPAGEEDRSGAISSKKLEKLLAGFEALVSRHGEAGKDAEVARLLADAADLAGGAGFESFWRHPLTWDRLAAFYRGRFPGVSFSDFFWNVRFLLQPVWRLLRFRDQLPGAAVYHSVSTGYAGLLGAMAGGRPGSTFLLSEHGIYVRERIAELLRLEWAAGGPGGGPEGVSPLRRLWMDFFVEAGRFAYHSADAIVSLFQKNAAYQAEFGAPPDRIGVIPNGIAIDRYRAVRQTRADKRRENPGRRNVGFFGRVVAIKDVKTLLRAARRVVRDCPDARFYLVGPTEEEPGYFAECRRLLDELGLQERVMFTGPAAPEQALPEFDLMVLSSVSEGLPFSLLEAFGAGMPVVATAVGACPELIEGHPGEQPALGSAGRVVPVADSGALAAAILELLGDRDLQDRLGAAGIARLERHYQEDAVIAQYRRLYQKLAEPAAAPAAA